MKEHHLAWLEAHPERSRDWLRRMMLEGFQVHHIDGDHSNNHPANLALIDGTDHMRLHGLFGLLRRDIHKVASKGGNNRWAGKSQQERSAHMRMMVMVKVKNDRRRRKAHRAANAERAEA